MYLRLHRISTFDCAWMFKHQQFLSFSAVLCLESTCFWNILWSCYYNDSKYITIKSTRKRSFSLFLLHYFSLDSFTCNFWINCKLYGSIVKSYTLWTFDFWICLAKLSWISSILVVSRKGLQKIHGGKRTFGLRKTSKQWIRETTSSLNKVIISFY